MRITQHGGCQTTSRFCDCCVKGIPHNVWCPALCLIIGTEIIQIMQLKLIAHFIPNAMENRRSRATIHRLLHHRKANTRYHWSAIFLPFTRSSMLKQFQFNIDIAFIYHIIVFPAVQRAQDIRPYLKNLAGPFFPAAGQENPAGMTKISQQEFFSAGISYSWPTGFIFRAGFWKKKRWGNPKSRKATGKKILPDS